MLRMKHNQSQPGKRLTRGPALRALGLLLGLWFFLPSLSAQGPCTLGCNGTLDGPLYVGIDQNCEIWLLAEQIVASMTDCPGPKQMVVRDSLSNLIAQGVDQVGFEALAYVGRRFSVTVTDLNTGLFCNGFIRIEDDMPPTFVSCPDRVVFCSEDLRPVRFGFPLVEDNCRDTVALSWQDTFIAADCLTDTAGVLERRWTANDGFGQTANCTQRITMLRMSLDSVVFPRSVILPCNTRHLHPDSLDYTYGWPLLDSMPLRNTGADTICSLVVQYQDDTTMVCSNINWVVQRTWTVTNSCTQFSRTATQTIQVLDTQGPTIVSCPSPITISTDPGRCTGSILLPLPTVTDNCAGEIGFEVSTSYEAVGLERHTNIPRGTHQIVYTAIDECGNRTSCQTTLTVVDNERPSAVCDDEILVALPNMGLAVASAVDFNEGSNDNCMPTLSYKVRRMAVGSCNNVNGDDAADEPGIQEWFDDRVVFCCNDINNDSIFVILRAYEINPGTGPVNPVREQIGGDLQGRYNECMVRVRVQDSQAPSFTSCPANRTVACSENLTNLATFGSPTVIDNCSFALTENVTTTLDECRRGTIVRTWTAVDPRGNSRTCTQTITVVNTSPLSPDSITWPLNYTTNACGAALDPDNLPQGHRRPVINGQGQGCGSIAVSYQDELFDDARPACYKIIRRWRIIDWCHYDGSSSQGVGIYTFNQMIKVMDNQMPVLTVPANVTVNIGADCQLAQVNLAAATAQDCQTNMLITNNSPYATSNGANASGRYPLGVTTVTFTASDRCGNVTTATMTVTVVDSQGPGVICQGGVSSTLMNMNGTPVLMLDVDDFSFAAYDNCTPSPNLTYSLRRQNSGSQQRVTQLTFGCADRGSQLVEVWATDAAGNTGFCLTYVIVTDNGNLCTTTGNGGGNNTTGGGGGGTGGTVTSAVIAGGVFTENGSEVENVEVQISGTNPFADVTGLDGIFRIEGLSVGQGYTITPRRNDDLLNGVSTIDLILISRHVLGSQLLNSPYKIIAADVDRSGHVSTLDIIRLRKVILGLDMQFPNNNTSWRFIEAGYVFPNPQNPFLTYFPERLIIDELTNNRTDADFIAVKVGDVNGSARPTNLGSTSERHNGLITNGQLDIEVESKAYEAGELVEIPFYAEYVNEIMGYQFTLEYDPNALDWQEAKPGELPNLFPENFAVINAAAGLVTTVWHEYGEVAPGGKIELFRLVFRAKQAGNVKDWIFLGSRLTVAEAYSQEGDLMGVQLVIKEDNEEEAGRFELYQNRPNPWKNETIIPFYLDPGGKARLSIYDMAGKLVYETEGTYDIGYHEIGVSRANLPAAGLFYYSLQAGERRATRKMVLTE